MTDCKEEWTVAREAYQNKSVRIGKRNRSVKPALFSCPVRRTTSSAHHNRPLPPALVTGIATPGPILILLSPPPLLTPTSSTLPFAKVMAGTTQSPQLHLIPCHAYLPTFVLHFGHSRRPSSLPCSSSDLIHERGSRKWWAHVKEFGDGCECGMRYADVARVRLSNQ